MLKAIVVIDGKDVHMQEIPEKSTQQITREFIQEFAEMNLEFTKEIRKRGALNVDSVMVRELRENAQALKELFNV